MFGELLSRRGHDLVRRQHRVTVLLLALDLGEEQGLGLLVKGSMVLDRRNLEELGELAEPKGDVVPLPLVPVVKWDDCAHRHIEKGNLDARREDEWCVHETILEFEPV